MNTTDSFVDITTANDPNESSLPQAILSADVSCARPNVRVTTTVSCVPFNSTQFYSS